MTTEQKHMDIVASLGCVICREVTGLYVPCQVHHIAEGSSKRSDFATAGLCHDHHEGALGVHGMGNKRFIVFFKLPGGTEYGLLVLVNKWRAKLGV